MIGQQLGTYVVLDQIGQGGMGAVYRARHAALGREAAVKVLLPQFTTNADVVQRFFNEAKAATSIRHPGIVEIYDYGMQHDGVAYIAMELLVGESMAKRMLRDPLRPSAALSFIRQVCGALGAAHNAGIIHRDLKPDNIHIVRDDEVAGGERIKLLDFGIAKIKQDQSSHSQTRTGSLMGTPTYMSPEQCRGVKVDHRTDIYALGCILFEMISGRTVFMGEGVGDVLGAHMFAAPANLDSLVPGLPTGLSELVDHMLAKDPAARPQTTTEVTLAIDRIAMNTSRPNMQSQPHVQATIMHPTTLSGSATATPTITPARSRWPLVVGALVVVGGVAATIAATRSGSDSKPVAASASQPIALDASVAVTAPDASNAPVAQTIDAVVDVTVAIDSTPTGAAVILDGAKVGTTPYNAAHPPRPGSTTYTLQASGFKEASLVVATDAAFARTVALEAEPKRDAKTTKTKKATASTTPKPVIQPKSEDDAVNPYK